MLYGFNERRGSVLARIADREGLRATNRARGEYPGSPQNEFQLVPFQNTEEDESVPEFGVMAPVSTALVDGLECVTVVRSNATFRRRCLVNTGPPVSPLDTGLGIWLTHDAPVLFGSGTPALFESWGPVVDSWALGQHRHGFLIQGAADTTTDPSSPVVRAVQQIVDRVKGKADSAIANGASGTVRVYIGTPGSETDSGQSIASCYNAGPAIADEAGVTVEWLHGKPYVWLANC